MLKSRKAGTNIIAMLILLILTSVSLSGCNSATSNKKVIEDVLEYDSYYSSFDLNVTKSEITKRQTNDTEKTDYVWVSIKAANDDFSYSADYKVTYIQYNDGWRFENCDTLNSSYSVKGTIDDSVAERCLKEEYDSYEQVDKNQNGNDAYFTYDVEVNDGYLTKQCTIKLVYSYSPATSWKLKDSKESNTINKLNIIGEWMFADEYGREYYVHVSDTSSNDITVSYEFADPKKSSVEGVSNGYSKLELHKATQTAYYFEMGKNWLCFYLNDSEYDDGFFYNDFQLIRQNTSDKPIVDRNEALSKLIQNDFENKITTAEGYIDSKEWDLAFQTVKTISSPPESLVARIDSIYENLLQHYFDHAELDNVRFCFDKIQNKSEKAISINDAVTTFSDKYGKWYGAWVYNPNSKYADYDRDIEITVGNKNGNLVLGVKDGFITCECYRVTDSSLTYLQNGSYYVLYWKSDSEISYCSWTNDVNKIDNMKEIYTLYKK